MRTLLTTPYLVVRSPSNIMNCTAEQRHINNITLTNEPPSLAYMLSVMCPALVVFVCTVIGNILVLAARANVGGGQRQTQLFVVNLAVADLLVGSLVLPLSISNLTLRRWPFGRTLCRLWVFADIVFCTASIVTICIISVDRYMAVTRPLKYRVVVTKGKCMCGIGFVWMVSIGVLLGTINWTPLDCVPSQVCFVGNEVRYLTHSVIFAFFIPAFVTLTLYWRIYQSAKQRQRAIDSGFMMVMGRNMNFLSSSVTRPHRLESGVTDNKSNAMRVHYGGGDIVQQQRHVLRTHQRVAITLGLVSCAFLFCWLPFFSLYMINSFCDCIPALVLDVTTWMGYCNSALNPIIYAFTVKEFKQTVKALLVSLGDWLCCRDSSRIGDDEHPNLQRLRKQYAMRRMSPAKMARLLAGYIDTSATGGGGGGMAEPVAEQNRLRKSNSWYSPKTRTPRPDSPIQHQHQMSNGDMLTIPETQTQNNIRLSVDGIDVDDESTLIVVLNAPDDMEETPQQRQQQEQQQKLHSPSEYSLKLYLSTIETQL